MNKDDWAKLAKWMGLVYAPIALLIIAIFFLIGYQN